MNSSKKNIFFLGLNLITIFFNPVYCAPKVDTSVKVDTLEKVDLSPLFETTQSIIFVVGVLGTIYLISKGINWLFVDKSTNINPTITNPNTTPISPAPTIEDLEARFNKLRETSVNSPRVVEEIVGVEESKRETIINAQEHVMDTLNTTTVQTGEILAQNDAVVSTLLSNEAILPCVIPSVSSYAEYKRLGYTNYEEVGIIGEKISPVTIHAQVSEPQADLVKEVATAVYENENLVQALNYKLSKEKFLYDTPYIGAHTDKHLFDTAYNKLENLFNMYKNHEIEQEVFIQGYLEAINMLYELKHITQFPNLQYKLDLLIKSLIDSRLVNGEVFWFYIEHYQHLIAYMDVATYLTWITC